MTNSDGKSKKEDSQNSDGKSNKEQLSQNSDDKSNEKQQRGSQYSDDKSNKEQVSQNSRRPYQYYHNNAPFPQLMRTQANPNQSIHSNSGSPQNQNRYSSSLPYQHVVYVQQVGSRQPAVYTSGRNNRESQWQPPPEYSGFTDVEIRKVFVRKVYLILMLQLLFTLGVISLFVFEPHVREFVQNNPFMLYISFGIFFGVYIGLACSGDLRRKFPTNIILLLIFTLAVSYMFGTLSCRYDNESIFMAVGISAAVCLAVTLFSFNTKFDFTSCGGMLCILLLILIIFGIIAIFIHSKVVTMIYAGLGAIVFTMYLAYDTQMLMGGKTIEIDPEEYILAAIQIYLDVLYVFMFILMIIGIGKE